MGKYKEHNIIHVKMRLIYLLLSANALLIRNNTAFADSPWKHLIHRDAIQFAIDNIEDKLTNNAKRIIPHPNMADSPLNKFVDAQTIEDVIERILLQNASTEFDALDYSKHTATFATAFIKTIHYPFLTDAMKARMLLVDKLRKIRINDNFNLITAKVRKIVKSAALEGIDAKTLLKNIILHIEESSMIDEIKKTMNYPVVREDFIRVMSRDFLNNDDLINTAMEALAPFLLEGIQNDDTIEVNLHSTEVSINELKRVLIPEYFSLMNDAISKAYRLDAVLNESYEKDNLIARHIEEEYEVITRRAISILYVTFSNSNYPDVLNDSLQFFLNSKILKTIKGYLHKKLNIAMNISEPYIAFDNHHKVIDIRSNIVKHVAFRTKIEFVSYSKVHHRFSKENRTTLTKFLIQSLKTEYKYIQTSQIEILKRTIPTIEEMINCCIPLGKCNLSDELKSFQNYLEKETINAYGFLPGMFTYSVPYYDVLGDVLSQSSNSLLMDRPSIHDKVEL